MKLKHLSNSGNKVTVRAEDSETTTIGMSTKLDVAAIEIVVVSRLFWSVGNVERRVGGCDSTCYTEP